MRPEPKYRNPYLTSDKPAMIGAEVYRVFFYPLLVLAMIDTRLIWRTVAAIGFILYGLYSIIGAHYGWTSVIIAMQTPFRFKIQPKVDHRLIEKVKRETIYYGLFWILMGITLFTMKGLDL